jgi:hypothetical protein
MRKIVVRLITLAAACLFVVLATGCATNSSSSGQNTGPTIKGYIDTSVEKRF